MIPSFSYISKKEAYQGIDRKRDGRKKRSRKNTKKETAAKETEAM